MATAVENKERQKLIMRIGGIALFVIVLGIALYMMLAPDAENKSPDTLGESDSMVPADPALLTQAQGNDNITLLPQAVTFQPGVPSNIFRITTGATPIVINDVRFDQTNQANMSIANIDCPQAPAALPAGQSCQVQVNWISGQPFSASIEIIAQGVTSGSEPPRDFREIVAVTAVAADPNIASTASQVGPNGVPVDQGAIVDPSQGAGGVPSQPAGNYAAAPSGPLQPAPASLREQQRQAYIQARRSGNMTAIQSQGQLNPSARSPYASWNSIGIAGAQSSNPVDMSRVITPDKPITAVVALTIDTNGLANGFTRAVATVDRDVYGNNGRTVVIPRGSRLIGTIGGGEERVGIAWSQLIRPDGVRFSFEGTSADAMGRGGVPGRVNQRLLARYGFSLLPPAVSAALTVALGGNSTSTSDGGGTTQQQDARSIAAQILNQPLNQIAQDIYSRRSQIPTQIIVPAGTRITVWATDDLRLRPAGERDSEAGANQQQRGGNFTNAREVDLEVGQSGTTSSRQSSGPRPLQPTAQRAQADNRAEGNSGLDSVPVGRVDAQGNYIAPGVNAPSPSTSPYAKSPSTTRSHWGQ